MGQNLTCSESNGSDSSWLWIDWLLDERCGDIKTSPWLFLLFGFAFAGLCGVFWEFWEFLCDQFLGMNLQRFAASDGTLFVGRAALMDTMGDLLTNTIGAALMGLFAWSQSKKMSVTLKVIN